MEFSISQSSLRLPATIPQRYKASSNFNRSSMPIKPTKSSNLTSKFCTNKLNLPVGLYGESRFPISSLSGQPKRDSIRASVEIESNDSDSVLAKAQADMAHPNFAKLGRFIAACYKFTLPYSMRQALMSTICLFARVLVENQQLFKWSLLLKALPGLIAIFFALVHYNGINQIFDVEIDRVNKPYLPLPSGELSLTQAWSLVIFSILAGLTIFWLNNADLISTSLYCLGLLLATFYSAPPFRFKASSLATIIVIPLTSVIKSIGILYTAKASLGLPFLWSPPVVFIITVPTILFAVICITKDIPDVEGDMKHNIRTFAARFGPKNVVHFAVGMLLLNYIGAIAASIFLPQAFNRNILLPAHTILPSLLLVQARKLDKANYAKEASAKFYQFIWKLLLAEFLLFPFI